MTDPEAAFLQIFRDEANERLDAFVDVLLALEDGRGEPDALNSLFRDAHTIKGSAGMIGLEHVHALAHAVEDVLATAREDGVLPPAVIEPLLKAADALRTSVNGDGEIVPGLVEELAGLTADAPQSETKGAGAAPAAAEPRVRAEPHRDGRTIRVPAEKLDRLLDLVGETVLHRERLEHGLTEAGIEQNERLVDELTFGDRLLGELRDAAMRTRTLPLRSITGPFPRAVRDIAAEHGKEVELVVTGGETELDRVILEGLSEPLAHLLRNAIAHGIEAPDEREQAGKPRRARVVLAAEQRGSLVAVTVGDDGRGVSEEVRAQVRPGTTLVNVLTEAGFSTSREVGDLSGRGVGLDAVQRHVEVVGGSLEIESESGQGTRVTLILPLTLALLEVLIVERGSHVFGLPLSSVQEAVSAGEERSVGGQTMLELRGEAIPLADLAELLGGRAPEPRSSPPALVLTSSGSRVAVICDRLVGEEEIVVKSLGSLLGSVSGYLGAAILGDGRIALLLDPTFLVRASRKSRERRKPQAIATAAPPKLLVVEDSFTVRELQRSVLEAAGYRVATARNGKDALESLSSDDEIDLVVTDVEMPEMDGLSLTEAIRNTPERSSLPVIVVTSRASAEDRQRGIDAGADAYMVKSSYDQQALLETVDRLVGR